LSSEDIFKNVWKYGRIKLKLGVFLKVRIMKIILLFGLHLFALLVLYFFTVKYITKYVVKTVAKMLMPGGAETESDLKTRVVEYLQNRKEEEKEQPDPQFFN